MNDFEKEKHQNGETEEELPADTFVSDDGLLIKEASFKKNKRSRKTVKKTDKSKKEKRTAEHRHKFFSLKRGGVIGSFLTRISEWVSHGLKHGFFGNVFSSLYTKENASFQNGFLSNALSPGNRALRKKDKKSKLRTRFAAFYESGFIHKLTVGASKWLMHSYVRLWGTLMISFGAMLEIVTCVRYFVIDRVLLTEHFWVGLITVILSLPLLSSKNRLGETLRGGVATRYLLVDFMELEEEKLESDAGRFGGYYSVAFLVGSGLGLLSYFVAPSAFVLTAVIIALFFGIMSYPELGMMGTLALIPFASVFENPSMVVLTLVLLEAISFMFKYIRGKRVIRFEIIDLFVAVFAALLFFGGVISAGGEASLRSALMYFGLLIAYFLIVNMFKKKELIYKTIKLMIVSATGIAIIGIFQQGAATVNPSWIDVSIFAEIGARVTSLFDNPNMLSIYLIIIFPFTLYTVAVSKEFKKKLFYLLCASAIALCTVFTWSRGAWLGIIVATCAFLVIYNLKNIWVIAMAFATLPIWSLLLPDSIIHRALSIGSLTDSSSVYRIYTWRGVLNMINDHLFTGIGVGESAFSEVYPIYSYAGTETVMHSHNLFLEITVQLGVVGLLVFIAIMFFFVQKSFNGIREAERADGRARAVTVAGIASVCGALTMGMTDHIWYNYRVFLVFWAVVALVSALVRINDSVKERELLRRVSNTQNADVDIEA